MLFSIQTKDAKTGVTKPESTSDDWWQQLATQRTIGWYFYFFALLLSSGHITFAAMCLRFDYYKTIMTGRHLSDLPAITKEEDTEAVPLISSLAMPATSDFAKPYYNASLFSWILTNVILLSGSFFARTIIQLSTAEYAFILSLAGPVGMVLSVLVVALFKGDLRVLWRYDETKEIEKDEGSVIKGPWRLDIISVLWRF